ncbi:MAG: DUF2141 domain-containing protein [Thermoflexibacter sp.]|jgi:uncharacterized protein (DUF2141 family)|nr:DUF2141 domain-containing protein [Thermoflexibacter sp.]
MLKFITSITLISSLFGIVNPRNAKAQDNLQVEILGFDAKPNTKIMVSVFAEKGFLKEPIQSKSIKVTGDKASVLFDLPAGEYAISTYQDLNSNGKMDRHFYGAPKEPYGFSNNIKPTIGPPDYEDCIVKVSEGKKIISITLIK